MTSGWLRRLLHRPRHSQLRFWIFQIHLYSGLALGLVTTVVGVTGSIIVYKPEMERLEAGSITRVESAGEPRPLSELHRRAQAATRKRIERVYIWGGPQAAWAFRASRGGTEREYIYVDQYRGRVLGTYPMDGTWLQWIYDLHDNLLLGRSGLIANGIGAWLLILMCATGMVVWFPGVTRLRQGFRYHWGAKWQIQNYDLHKVLGIAALAALVVIGFTGASYAFPAGYRRFFGALTGSAAGPHDVQSAVRSDRTPASLDAVLQAAGTAIPGAELTVLTWPAGAKGAFLSRQRLPGDWSRLGDQYVYIDQYSAAVLRADASSRLPAAARIMLTMSPLHYGTFGGFATRLLWIFMGLAPGVLAVSGFLMWWNRVAARKLIALLPGPPSLEPALPPVSPQVGDSLRDRQTRKEPRRSA
jgi:uncharacterized iron-regulated membrane protein